MDLRAPIGWFFLLVGAILLVAAPGVPVNRCSGIVMLVFGGVFTWLGFTARRGG